MYIGSVRFYKHIIYAVLIALILLAVYGLVQVGNLVVNKHQGTPEESGGFSQAVTEGQEDENKDLEPSLPDADTANEPPEKEAEAPDEKPQQHDVTVQEEEADPIEEEWVLDFVQSRIKYQSLYPELHNELPEIQEHKPKTVYLTFDDGPSERTDEVLDILKERNIKATFFIVTRNNNLDILKRIAEEGHTIGIHSHTHEYKEIYSSVEAFLDDFSTCYNKIYEAAGVKPQIFRFPGGSINAYNRGTYQEIISEMLRRGFLYYDWNISTQDTDKYANKERVLESVKAGFADQNSIIVLCHDNRNKHHTVQALSAIIDFFEEQGYTFEKLDNTVEPIVFAYPT